MADLYAAIDPAPPWTAVARGAILTALGRTADPRWNALLLSQLLDDYFEIHVAALEALGACGTADLLPQIRPFAQGILRPQVVKTAARAAIDAIEARHGTLDGALSLATISGGEVSLGDDTGPPPPKARR